MQLKQNSQTALIKESYVSLSYMFGWELIVNDLGG